MNKIILIVSTLTILSCNSNSTQSSKTNNSDNESNPTQDTLKDIDSDQVTFQVDGKTVLPINYNGSSAFTEVTDFQHDEVLHQVDYPKKGASIDNVQIIRDKKNRIIIQYNDLKDLPIKAREIDLGEINEYNLSFKTEWTEVDSKNDEMELVIWWESFDANNGVESGYEMERKGILITSTSNAYPYLAFCYYDLLASYVASEEANLDDENYHAKSANDSEWEICSKQYSLTLSEGNLILQKEEIRSEGITDCDTSNYYAEGEYTYFEASGHYELIPN